MAFVYSFLIGGCICALAQLLTELKLPAPAILIGFVAAGGILTPLGVVDALSGLGAGGVCTMAVGFGNAAYSAGAALAGGNPVPLAMVLLLLVVLVFIGAACGGQLMKRETME